MKRHTFLATALLSVGLCGSWLACSTPKTSEQTISPELASALVPSTNASTKKVAYAIAAQSAFRKLRLTADLEAYVGGESANSLVIETARFTTESSRENFLQVLRDSNEIPKMCEIGFTQVVLKDPYDAIPPTAHRLGCK